MQNRRMKLLALAALFILVVAGGVLLLTLGGGGESEREPDPIPEATPPSNAEQPGETPRPEASATAPLLVKRRSSRSFRARRFPGLLCI